MPAPSSPRSCSRSPCSPVTRTTTMDGERLERDRHHDQRDRGQHRNREQLRLRALDHRSQRRRGLRDARHRLRHQGERRLDRVARRLRRDQGRGEDAERRQQGGREGGGRRARRPVRRRGVHRGRDDQEHGRGPHGRRRHLGRVAPRERGRHAVGARAHTIAGSMSLGASLAASYSLADIEGGSHVSAEGASRRIDRRRRHEQALRRPRTTPSTATANVGSAGASRRGHLDPDRADLGLDHAVLRRLGHRRHGLQRRGDAASTPRRASADPIAIGLFAGAGAAADADITSGAQVNAGVGQHATLTLSGSCGDDQGEARRTTRRRRRTPGSRSASAAASRSSPSRRTTAAAATPRSTASSSRPRSSPCRPTRRGTRTRTSSSSPISLGFGAAFAAATATRRRRLAVRSTRRSLGARHEHPQPGHRDHASRRRAARARSRPRTAARAASSAAARS